MVMAALFFVLFLTVALAWFGHREASMYLFTATFFFGVGLLFHHMTSTIGLAL